MFELLATLFPIALIDSLSVVPVAIVPLILVLGGKRPILGTFSFMAGIIVTYFPFGVLLLYGFDALFQVLAGHFMRWWRKEPDFGELLIQLFVGILLVVYGQRLCRRKQIKGSNLSKGSSINPVQAFSIGAIINLSGMWGALPYFAAIAQILKEDPSPLGMITALSFYNGVFALPLFSFMVLYLVFGERSSRLFATISDGIIRWGNKLIPILLIGLGFILVIDALGWFYGTPLLVASGRGNG